MSCCEGKSSKCLHPQPEEMDDKGHIKKESYEYEKESAERKLCVKLKAGGKRLKQEVTIWLSQSAL